MWYFKSYVLCDPLLYSIYFSTLLKVDIILKCSPKGEGVNPIPHNYINAGVKAATDPLIKAIDDHWGKAVLLTGCAGAVIGEGDARQRAVRAAITSAAAGGVVLALLAMLT